MASIPQDKSFDSTLALLRDGYLFISRRAALYQSDIFMTKLMLQPVICLSGREAAQLFYDNTRFKRQGAMPRRIQQSLVGKNGVQMLDDEAHRNRKAMFMALMTEERIQQLNQLFVSHWQKQAEHWQHTACIILFKEMQRILCCAACEWAGVPLKEEEITKRAEDLGDMIDAFGAIGPRYWRGRLARNRSERWIEGIVKAARVDKESTPPDTPLYHLTFHQDAKGRWLSVPVVAVEMLNLLRPIVAIATYITFTALALHQHPQYRTMLQSGELSLHAFVQEVRRFYPFTPFVGARAREAFDWQGYHFSKDQLVILDVHGIDHDARLWEAPERFMPERFTEYPEDDAFSFIPQGGGDYHHNHRCAGEWITISIMEIALDFLVNHMEYDVPVQDTSYSLSRMPTLPESGMVLEKVRWVG